VCERAKLCIAGRSNRQLRLHAGRGSQPAVSSRTEWPNGELRLRCPLQWLLQGRIFTVPSGGVNYPTLVFNCGGILFYTTNNQDYQLFEEIAQASIGFGIAAGVGALAGTLVNTVTTIIGQGSQAQTINNLVRIAIQADEAEAAEDAADVVLPAA
jgi:hypothetical protein